MFEIITNHEKIFIASNLRYCTIVKFDLWSWICIRFCSSQGMQRVALWEFKPCKCYREALVCSPPAATLALCKGYLQTGWKIGLVTTGKEHSKAHHWWWWWWSAKNRNKNSKEHARKAYTVTAGDCFNSFFYTRFYFASKKIIASSDLCFSLSRQWAKGEQTKVAQTTGCATYFTVSPRGSTQNADVGLQSYVPRLDLESHQYTTLTNYAWLT